MEAGSFVYSLVGGVLIGIAVSLMLLFNGRVTGISGILFQSFSNLSKENLWRLFFLLGLVVGGIFIRSIHPALLVNNSVRSPIVILLAGLLVGYGTVVGGGCTSGHGVCGISRLSVRSLIATITFIIFGFFSVQLMRYLLTGGS